MSLTLEHVSFIYNEGTGFEKQALSDISLELGDGEFVGLIGHTGSGKSTLIQLFNGLLAPASGRVLYNGEDVFAQGFSRRSLRAKVGLVFQYPEHQLFEADVLSDVCFGPLNLRLSREEAKRRAREALSLVGLEEHYYAQSPFDLSGGQKRRVAIAGVLAMEPEVLILDEPAAGLDPQGRREVLDLVKRLHAERGITVVLVSHSMEDVAEYVQRILVMSKGQLLMDGTVSEVFMRGEELKATGLSVPAVTRILQGLREKGFHVRTDITTVREARDEIMYLFRTARSTCC